jgi:quinone-modifying oxidoreductase subunit QmoB
MENKIGVYICNGCSIKQSLDVDKLVEVATSEMEAPVCRVHDALCSQEGIQLVEADIDGEEINRVVIAACSQRAFPESFDFGADVLTDRVNLREQVAWCHAPNDEDTQMLAEDYIRMGVARVKTVAPPEPLIEETSKDLLVVGGGMTGMTAAKSAAAAGYNVTLVEKEDRLGGWAARFRQTFPKSPPYKDLEDSGWQELAREIEAEPNITIQKSTIVKKTSGQPGQFCVDLQNSGSTTQITVGSIILASGWKPYDADKLTHLGYGSSPDVITNIQMEEMVSNGGIKRPSNGGSVESVVFIQCAGSRDQDHLPYCSSVCCRVSLKQVMYVREQHPDAKIYVIYKDIRSPAQYERFYANVQEDEGVFLTKGEIASVTKDSDGQISVDVRETLLGDDIRIKADLVVLATGMVPTTKVDDVLDSGDAEKDTSEGEESQAEADQKPGEETQAEAAEPGETILNLSYRQGPDLPTLKYGFPDSHFICFPYETRRTGIYAAGAVRAPMDLGGCANDATGAALKSIQTIEAVARGAAVHPRAGDLSYPEFFMQKCTQCKRCTEECPFGAIDEDAKGTPMPNPMRCRRCGICFGACPERIISFKNFSVHMVSQMIKSIHIPDEFEEKPRILAFACENDALPLIDMAGAMRLQYNAMIRIIPLRCLGSMNSVWVGDALASGFDGVLLMGCKKGDEYQCHFVRGSELADYRMGNVREKLKQLVLEEERVEMQELSITDYRKIPKIMDDFLDVIETAGPNPYKGM